jgi:dihydroflavonol-4-reductase
MHKLLVTGATGFLGSHLVANLREHGHEVVALCRGDEPELEDQGIRVLLGDVLDAKSVQRAAEGCEGAYHAAGKVSRKPEDAEELYRLHVEGTRNVLSACRAAGVKRVVFASTSGTVAVSDDPKRVATEDDEAPAVLLSRWPYYRAKLYAERAALAENGAELEVVSVNPTLLLGPGDLRGSSTEDIRLFLERRIPAVPSGGLSYVDARDAAEAMRLAMSRGEPGQRYLVGACNLTIRDFFARLSRVSGVRAPWVPMPRAPELARAGAKLFERTAARWLGLGPSVDPVSLEMAQYYWYLDSTRTQTVLGWSARDPVETLADTVRDLRARGVVWPPADGTITATA